MGRVVFRSRNLLGGGVGKPLRRWGAAELQSAWRSIDECILINPKANEEQSRAGYMEREKKNKVFVTDFGKPRIGRKRHDEDARDGLSGVTPHL